MRKNKKVTYIMFLFIFIALISIGYAYLNTTLSINGTTDVEANTWNVYWDNVQVTSGSVAAEIPTIDTSKTAVSFSVHLSQPGDFYEFTVDVKNDGSIDAMIDTIVKTINGSTTVPEYLNYSVTYDDDAPIVEKYLLSANTTETYKVRVEYRTDIDPSALPDSPRSLNMVFGTPFVQADDDANMLNGTIYQVSRFWGPPGKFYIGQPLPEDENYYDNYQDAINELQEPQFIKNVVRHGIITEAYVGFILNGEPHYVRGAGATYNTETGYYNMDSAFFNENKQILYNLFGEENCTMHYYSYIEEISPGHYQDVVTDIEYSVTCSNSDINLDVESNGSIWFFGDSYYYLCWVGDDGRSDCHQENW